MIPTLVTADLHLSSNPRDAYRHQFMRQLPALLRKLKIKRLLVVGDLTEAKDEHNAALVNDTVEHFCAAAEVCDVIAVQGNHDWLSSPDNAYFRFLARLPGIQWVRTPTELDDDCILLPHTTDHERDWADIDFKRYRYAFAHQCFAGAESDSGFKLSGVPLSFFPKSLQIISGDIHRPQTVGQLTYVGSPYSVDFGDTIESRVLVVDGKGVHSIPVDGPQKRLVTVRSLADLTKLKGLLKGDILKVRVEFPQEKAPEWPELAAQVRNWGQAGGFQVHAVQPVLTGAKASMTTTRKVAPAQSDEELLQAYVKQQAVDKATAKAGLKLL